MPDCECRYFLPAGLTAKHLLNQPLPCSDSRGDYPHPPKPVHFDLIPDPTSLKVSRSWAEPMLIIRPSQKAASLLKYGLSLTPISPDDPYQAEHVSVEKWENSQGNLVHQHLNLIPRLDDGSERVMNMVKARYGQDCFLHLRSEIINGCFGVFPYCSVCPDSGIMYRVADHTMVAMRPENSQFIYRDSSGRDRPMRDTNLEFDTQNYYRSKLSQHPPLVEFAFDQIGFGDSAETVTPAIRFWGGLEIIPATFAEAEVHISRMISAKIYHPGLVRAVIRPYVKLEPLAGLLEGGYDYR